MKGDNLVDAQSLEKLYPTTAGQSSEEAVKKVGGGL